VRCYDFEQTNSREITVRQTTSITLIALIAMLFQASCFGQTRDEQVLSDRESLKDDDNWYYDDLQSGLKTARAQNKPLMVVLRCIP